MTISTNGFMTESLTLKASGTLKIGDAVVLSESNTVSAASENDIICGVVAHIRNGICAVQLHGTVTIPFTGTAPAVGYSELCSDGASGVKSGTGREYLVLSVDEIASTVTFIL